MLSIARRSRCSDHPLISVIDPIMNFPHYQPLASALPEVADGASLRLLAVAALLLLNAFFVAAEFAMVKLRAGGLDGAGGQDARQRVWANRAGQRGTRLLYFGGGNPSGLPR